MTQYIPGNNTKMDLTSRNCGLFQDRKREKFTIIRNLMLDLMELRKQLLSGTLTQDQSKETKRRLTRKVDWGNRYACDSLIHFKIY